MDEGPVRVLMPGRAEGEVLLLEEPLSFWGGVDPATGTVTDRSHPQVGATVTGKVILMPRARGSSSASSVLAGMIRAGSGPAALILTETDPILVLGALVAAELYGDAIPLLLASPATMNRVARYSRVRIGLRGDCVEV